jgi:16S rRNA processing protein RimM
LRGAVRIEVLTDNPSRFDVGQAVYREGSNEPLTITSSHRDGPGLLVRFAEVTDRESAVERLRDAYLEALPESLDANTFYWHDILGCSVVSATGDDLGTVKDVFRVGESEVYEVHGPLGELLIPAIGDVVKELSPAEKRIVVDADALGLTTPADSEIRP